MESMTLLTVAVALIGSIHIAERVASVFAAKGKVEAAPAATKRNAWYCFFKMSSLLGPDWKPLEERERDQNKMRNTRRDERRQQQARRPRLYA